MQIQDNKINIIEEAQENKEENLPCNNLDYDIDIIPNSKLIQLNELIVHKTYGIGRFKGINIIKVGNFSYDCIKLEYKNQEFVYLNAIDINIKFHSCYGLLMTQNKEAMKELEKLSLAFPNSKVNLITEKLGAVTYSNLTCLNQSGSFYPTKVFFDGKTHPGIFLKQEEIKQSKEHLIELLETLHKNEITPKFTIHDFISNNSNLFCYKYEEYINSEQVYNKYRKDIMNKIEGHLIHLGKNKEFIKELNKIQKSKIKVVNDWFILSFRLKKHQKKY
ncbi:MAG: CarD family transcriptional regulator [Rickettsiales bacterium]